MTVLKPDLLHSGFSVVQFYGMISATSATLFTGILCKLSCQFHISSVVLSRWRRAAVVRQDVFTDAQEGRNTGASLWRGGFI